MAYTDCTTNLIINKTLSDRISVVTGVKQGDPISALLFAMFLEPFCLKVQNNQNIRGFRFLTHEIKILSYADDIAIFCGDKTSIKEAVKDAKEFCSFTGSAINWQKCLGFWHGEWEDKPECYESIKFTTVPSSYLGVPLQYYKDATSQWQSQLKNESANIKVGRTKYVYFHPCDGV